VGVAREKLHPIHRPSPSSFRLAAFVARSRDHKAMTIDLEIVFLRDGLAKGDELIGLEFNQLLTFLAVKMIVLRIAIIMLVDGSPLQIHLAQQAGFDHFAKRSIDGGAADLLIGTVSKLFDEIVGFEMFMLSEDGFNNRSTLLSNTFPATLEIFLESLYRRRRYFNASEI